MTLGRIAIALTLGATALTLGGFLATGSLALATGLLVAPLPALVVYGLLPEWSDWTVRDLRQRGRGDDAVGSGLDRALRDPAPPGLPEDDGAFFVPDCPPLCPPAGPGAPPTETVWGAPLP